MIVFYICITTLEHELGETVTKTFHSLNALKATHSCYEHCGVYKVTLKEDGTWTKEVIVKPKKDV